MANADQLPAANDVLADKYRIGPVLGQGGMGIVLAAMHLHLEERFAIKFLLPELSNEPALVARFLREGRASIKIRSEHVVRVLDVATLPGGTPYMVMEYLEGTNFEDLLEQQGPLPIDVAVDHVLQATEALAEAHALGMVHRDLKPANLFLVHRADGSPCVKVLDFGITKVLDPKGVLSDLDTTKATDVMGSPRYMSPEQMRSARAIDARADIWALGVILQELITGSAPFDGTTMPDLLAAILQDRPVPLSWLRPDAPPELDAVIAKCLEKEASARYRDVAELTQALACFGTQSARVSADRVSRVIRPVGAGGTGSIAPPPRSTQPPAAEFRPEPPSSGALATVSATANAWGATGAPSRSAARTVGLAVGSLFFASVLILAIFGTQAQHASPQARTAASTSPSAPSEPPPAPTMLSVAPEDSPANAVESGLSETSTPPSATSATTFAPSPKEPVLVQTKRRTPVAAPSPAATATATATAPAERDLFDGPK